METYPIFIWWYSGEDKFKENAIKLSQRCEELDIPHFYEELLWEKYIKDFDTVKDYSSHRYLLFKLSFCWVYEKLLEFKKPIFLLHSDNSILMKPEAEMFSGLDIGYSIGLDKTKKRRNRRLILSHCMYFNYTQTVFDFFTILLTKYKTIRSEFPAEHGLLANTLLDFTGTVKDIDTFEKVPDAVPLWHKWIYKKRWNDNKKFGYRSTIRPLKGKYRKYVGSAKTQDTYILHQ